MIKFTYEGGEHIFDKKKGYIGFKNKEGDLISDNFELSGSFDLKLKKGDLYKKQYQEIFESLGFTKKNQ